MTENVHPLLSNPFIITPEACSGHQHLHSPLVALLLVVELISQSLLKDISDSALTVGVGFSDDLKYSHTPFQYIFFNS